MPESLWLFPILSGYYFLTRYVYFKYKYDRIETQRRAKNTKQNESNLRRYA